MNPELEEQVQQLRRIIEAASRTEAAVDRFPLDNYDYEYHYYDAMKNLANRCPEWEAPAGYHWSNAGPYYYPT